MFSEQNISSEFHWNGKGFCWIAKDDSLIKERKRWKFVNKYFEARKKNFIFDRQRAGEMEGVEVYCK